MKIQSLFCIQLLNFIILSILVCNFSVNGQDNIDSKSFLSPAEEKFQIVDELASPWRSSGCSEINREFQEPNCHSITPKEWKGSDMLTLYNEDGSVWYNFSVNPESSKHFLQNQRKDFLPFATFLSSADVVILRMIKESPNWYEVEVNEETQVTKFIKKDDPMWAKTKWTFWLYEIKFFKTSDDHSQLLDAPNGKTMKVSSNLQFYHFRFLKSDGDWAYVEGLGNQKLYYGWIRWRNGRNILIKSSNGLFNMAQEKSVK